MKYILTLFTVLILTVTSLTARQTGIEMADTMRSSGKIYVVIAVIVVVFLGIAFYLFSLDKRLKKIERTK